jgi:hypothetical protein
MISVWTSLIYPWDSRIGPNDDRGRWEYRTRKIMKARGWSLHFGGN